MNVRLAACEPCRIAKLACDHERPTCDRCRGRGQGETCTYRARPFKRKRGYQNQAAEHENEHEHTALDHVATSPRRSPIHSPPSPQQHRYPNPGFLGSSSHSTIFNHVSSCANTDDQASPHDALRQTPPPSYSSNSAMDPHHHQATVKRGMHALSQVAQLNISSLKSLVEVWLSTGVNLPLAGPFVSGCALAVLNMVERSPTPANGNESSQWASQHSARLSKSTRRPLIFRRDSSVADFVSQFYGDNVRWETLGIFFAAASRATLDLGFFPLLYTGEEQRHKLIMLLTDIGDYCLEACLELDCLNDLQLILQYENFIVYSQVYGDQSHLSWRRMGDLTSSLFALGFHENIDDQISQIPNFIAQLRKAAFSRIYSADKNLAVFLGRPPRLIRTYCVHQLPSNIPGLWNMTDNTIVNTATGLPPNETLNSMYDSGETDAINYTADTRCSALFASLKEEILELFRDRDPYRQVEKASLIRSQATKQWQMLPTHFKLVTNLKDCHLKRPFERDFLVGTRLDHLHTLFLLDLVLLRHISEPNESLLKVAVEMLSLVVEVIVLRDRLVNSGTSLIWKVAQYGLPAAGIASLAMLNPSVGKDIAPLLRSKILQDLSVLVAEVRTGAVIQAGQPNFALFTRATKTIQSLLNIVMGGELPSKRPEVGPAVQQQHLNSEPTEDWEPWVNADIWDFEINFWDNLAEHPTLQGFDYGA